MASRTLVAISVLVALSGAAHAHVFEIHCVEAPAFRIDRREVVWAGFLTPEEALERGVVGVVRRYLERIVTGKA